MKLLTLFSLLFYSALSYSANLESEFSQIKFLIDKATMCVPEQTPTGAKFCTGMLLSKETEKELASLSLPQCFSQIKTNGLKVITKRPEVPSSSYIQFEQSTKRALVLHDKKEAYFKPDARRIDCIHELLHVYQRTSSTGNALSPVSRSKRTKRVKKLLNSKVDVIESFEREGKIDKAHAAAAKLSPFIAKLGEWEELINWLDEKEIYYYIYKNCEELSCTLDDKEIALSNLVRFKKRFPWEYGNSFISDAREIILAREHESFVEIQNFKLISNEQITRLKKIWVAPTGKLISTLVSEGVKVVRSPVKSGSEGPLHSEVSTLKFANIKKPLFSDNFDGRNFDGSSFICDSKSSMVVVSEGSSRLQVVREYARLLFSEANPVLCSINKDKKQLSAEFKLGKVERKKFEKKLLFFRALLRKLNIEVYQAMLKHIDLTDDEKSMIMTSLITQTFATSKDSYVEHNPISLSYGEENSLPSIKVDGESFVLDTGAMDSVARPSKFLPIHFDKLGKIKNLSFQLASRKKVEAPKVMLNFPVNIGEGRFSSTGWGLADLEIPGVTGIVGMDFLSRGDFVLDIKAKRLVFTVLGDAPKNSLPLVREHDGRIKSLEFICPDSRRLRLDTGSQVHGDISYKIGKDNFSALEKGESYSCGPLKVSGEFEHSSNSGVLFDRGVVLNLGWPWLKQFSKVSVSINNGWIEFTK